jgi:transcriptional regulator with XRE-family HTH domain
MDQTKAVPLRGIVGPLFRQRREELGLRLDDVAEYVRDAGMVGWNRTTVSALELGQRELDLEEVWLVCAAMEIGLAELLGRQAPDSAVSVGDAGTWDFGLIREVLTGERDGLAGRLAGVREVQAKRQEELDVERDAGDKTVQRVAHQLGSDPVTVAKFAWALWGRPLTRERDLRVAQLAEAGASPRTLQALRGHVTRDLVKQLRGVVV